MRVTFRSPHRSAAGTPQLDVILVPENDDQLNPVGVKGIGELANVGTAAAVANAVYHATSIRVRELPIRLAVGVAAQNPDCADMRSKRGGLVLRVSLEP